jgi:hypothetical protein
MKFKKLKPIKWRETIPFSFIVHSIVHRPARRLPKHKVYKKKKENKKNLARDW